MTQEEKQAMMQSVAVDGIRKMQERSKADGAALKEQIQAGQKEDKQESFSLPAGSQSKGFTFEPMDAISWTPLDWWLKGLLPKRGIGQIYGFSGSGKSFLAWDMAFALAMGRDWFQWRFAGRNKRERPDVYYLCLEGAAGFKLRADAILCRERKKDAGFTVPQNLLLSRDDFDLTDVERVDALVEYIGKRSDGVNPVLFIDTQGKALPGHDINDAEQMTAVMRSVQDLADKINGFVMLIAHIGKSADASKGAAGSYVQRADSDLQISVEKKGKSRKFIVQKVKDDADGQSVEFMLHSWPLGVDADGLPESSCTVEPLDVEAESKLTDKQSDGLRWLKAAYDRAGKKAGEAITMDAWRDACAFELGLEKTDKKVHNLVSRRREALAKEGVIVGGSSSSSDVILIEGF